MALEEERWARENVWLRQMLMSPSGGGKTRGALEIATKLFGGSLDVVGIDTERGRMKLYADKYPLAGYLQLNEDHSPENWQRAIEWAYRKAPGGLAIFDSFSHEWMGKNGVLQQVDRFGDWKDVRPRHSKVLDDMMALPMHVIVCVRSKIQYLVGEEEKDGRTRQTVTKLGLGPIQDDAIIYEFDVVGRIDPTTHDCRFENRCDPLVDTVRQLIPGDEVAGILTKWLSEGEPPKLAEPASDKDVAKLRKLLGDLGHPPDVIEDGITKVTQRSGGVLPAEYVQKKIEEHEAALAAKNGSKADAKANGGKAETQEALTPS